LTGAITPRAALTSSNADPEEKKNYRTLNKLPTLPGVTPLLSPFVKGDSGGFHPPIKPRSLSKTQPNVPLSVLAVTLRGGRDVKVDLPEP